MQYHFSFRHKDGGYQVILSYKDQFGKWRQKSKQGFRTKKEAQAAGDELVRLVQKLGSFPLNEDLKNLSLKDFFEIFLSEYGQNLRINTIYNYKSAMNFLGEMANLPVSKISPLMITHKFTTKDYKVTTLQIYRNNLRSIFNYAINPYHIIQENPVQLVISASKEPSSVDSYSAEELQTILNRMKKLNYQYYCACAIAAYAGLRMGEVMALTWSDIDFENSCITVSKQCYDYINHAYNQTSPFVPLKTSNSYRIVPIPPILLRILDVYRSSFKPYSVDRLFKSHFRVPINIKLKQIGGKNFHAFRHTYATTLLAKGLDIKTVSALLGDTVATVMNIYIHYTDDMRKNAAKEIKEIFK